MPVSRHSRCGATERPTFTDSEGLGNRNPGWTDPTLPPPVVPGRRGSPRATHHPPSLPPGSRGGGGGRPALQCSPPPPRPSPPPPPLFTLFHLALRRECRARRSHTAAPFLAGLGPRATSREVSDEAQWRPPLRMRRRSGRRRWQPRPSSSPAPARSRQLLARAAALRGSRELRAG